MRIPNPNEKNTPEPGRCGTMVTLYGIDANKLDEVAEEIAWNSM